MDENKFDHLAKTLALASSRRQFVKLMAGSVIGGAISLLLPAVAFAKNPHACGDTGTPCKGSGDCCSRSCCNGTCCPQGECFQGVRCVA